MSVHKLILEVTDPEDGAYFINKALTRIHGYLHRHGKSNIGLYFQHDTIMLYASELCELERILADEALIHDVNRHIFSAKFEQADGEITLCKRVRVVSASEIKCKVSDVILWHGCRTDRKSIKCKVSDVIRYVRNNSDLSSEDIETKRRELLEYYNERAENASKKYFVIKTREKRFTIFVKSVRVQNDEFRKLKFNSYGLLRKL